jgi:hypothetical protein
MNFNSKNWLLIGTCSVLLLYRLLICFSFETDLSVGEGNNIWNAVNVLEGKKLYTNPEEAPYEIFQYTPLSQIPLVLFATFLDSESHFSAFYIMVFGRLMSLIYNVITFYCVFKILKNQLQVGHNLALWGSILGFTLLTHLAFAVRPDAMSLLFITSGLYLFGEGYFNGPKKYYTLSGAVFAFSFFVKQDSFLILSALGFILLISKNFRGLLILSVSFLTTFVIVLGLFYFLLGESFLVSIFGGLNNPVVWTRALLVFERYLQFYGFIFFLALFFIFYWNKKTVTSKSKYYLGSLMALSFILAFGTSFKDGSWINYYSLFNIVLILVLFSGISSFYDENENKAFYNSFSKVIVIFIGVFIYQQVFIFTSPFLKIGASYSSVQNLERNFHNFIQIAKDKKLVIFTDDTKLKLLFAGNTIFPNTEYYPVSRFSKEGYAQSPSSKKLTHIIKNNDSNESQFSALTEFKVPQPTAEMKKINVLNYTIYEY